MASFNDKRTPPGVFTEVGPEPQKPAAPAVRRPPPARTEHTAAQRTNRFMGIDRKK